MPTPNPKQVYIVDTAQTATKTYRVEAESPEQANSDPQRGQLIHSEVGPEIITGTVPEIP